MQDMVARSLDGKYTNLRRCRSLPHINMTRRDGQYRYEVDFQSHAVKRGRRKNPKQRYCGRYSFSRTHFGEILRDENIQDRIRIRSTSIRGQAERVSRLESCSMYDAVYQCLSPEPDQQLHDVAVQPSAPISAVMMRRELARLSCDRNQYHYSLYRLLRASIMAKLNRLYENTTLGSVRKSSQKVLLINHRNERFKWSDVLWLQLQAAVAGRQMKSPRDQIRSTREHDKYLLVEREKQKAVLDEIRNFRLNNKIKARLPSQPPSADSYDQNSLKAGLKLVRNLLERYESFVALFPNIISMERSTKLDESIKTRIRILYAWYNITLDLYSRIKEVGVILGIYKNKESARCSSPSPNLVIKDTPTATQPVGVLSWPSLDSPMDDYESLKPSQKSCELTHASSSPQSLLLQMTMQTTSDLPALLEQPNSIYTAFVSRSLRRKGMRKVLQRLDSVCLLTIKKVIAMVKKSSVAHAQVVGDESKERSIDYITALTPECYISECLKFDDKQISDLPHGLTSHEQFSAMGLPSFENLFLFLTRVPLDLVHEWLKMRGSAQLPSDLLTLQTVMEDCHDCIEAAIAVKYRFVSLLQLAGVDSKVLFSCLLPFEDELAEVFKNYLICVRELVREEVGTEEIGAEWTERVIQDLTSQWTIAKRFAVNVVCGESETVHRFCVIAGDLMRKMVNDYLPEKESLMEECRSAFENAPISGFYDCEFLRPRQASQIFIACRHFKSLIGQMKDRSLRSLAFVRTLLMDIEICALYRFKYAEIDIYISQLLDSHHSLVIISNDLPSVNNNYIIFCDKNASENADFVRILLNITCSRYSSELPKSITNWQVPVFNLYFFSSRYFSTGYLLIIRLETCFSGFVQNKWIGSRLIVELDVDSELSLRYLQLSGHACLVAINACSLPKMRELFILNMTVEDECIFEIVEEQASCHDIAIESVKEIRELAYLTCKMLFENLAGKIVEDILDGQELSSLDINELESVRATLIQAYNLAFEYHREFYRILPKHSCRSFALQTIRWAKQWLHFALEFISQGDGTVPLWAIQSFQFLILAACPELSSLLTHSEFQDFVKTVDAYIAHVVGTNIPDPGLINEAFIGHEPSKAANFGNAVESKPYCMEDAVARTLRIQELLHNIDEKRNKHLEADSKIGRVKEGGRRALSLSTYFNPKKRAPFEWQRLEKKIGSGKFGTVYVVMNLTENCLMAMKQIRIERNDKALLALVDEVENLSLLDHPNLVKYYAVEVHREELLIFMEYCSEGTLEGVCREGLLDMQCVRRYTHFLLKGVEYIHKKMIIHRDIKPANIFLGTKDVLKLGDFGSSVRLKNGSTACGEVAEWVGTPAYMAPEVQTLGGRIEISGKEELAGYGRAADIWSVGCVVLEMCTGKPPWHECEQVLQIVFRVGSGMRPTIPQSLQADATCYSFLEQCFQAEPNKRATAGQLDQHPFANINAGESCDSRSYFYL